MGGKRETAGNGIGNLAKTNNGKSSWCMAVSGKREWKQRKKWAETAG